MKNERSNKRVLVLIGLLVGLLPGMLLGTGGCAQRTPAPIDTLDMVPQSPPAATDVVKVVFTPGISPSRAVRSW